jgi:hypothetical protein
MGSGGTTTAVDAGLRRRSALRRNNAS